VAAVQQRASTQPPLLKTRCQRPHVVCIRAICAPARQPCRRTLQRLRDRGRRVESVRIQPRYAEKRAPRWCGDVLHPPRRSVRAADTVRRHMRIRVIRQQVWFTCKRVYVWQAARSVAAGDSFMHGMRGDSAAVADAAPASAATGVRGAGGRLVAARAPGVKARNAAPPFARATISAAAVNER